VSSSDVTIDMRGHALYGAGANTTGIVLNGGVQNVIIKNGTIENMRGSFPNGVGIQDAVGHSSTLQNIMIQNMNFNNNDGAAIIMGNSAANVYAVDGILIQNCKGYNSTGISLAGSRSGIVQGCDFTQNTGSFAFAAIGAQGPSNALLADSFLIEDCILTGSAILIGSGIGIALTHNAVIRNCIVQKSGLLSSIQTNFCDNIVISDCVVESDSFGMSLLGQVAPGAALLIERCVCRAEAGIVILNGLTNFGPSFFSSVKVVDCVAESVIPNPLITGLFLGAFTIYDGIPDQTVSNIIFKRCCATGDFLSGFVLTCTAAGSLSNIVFEDCVAQHSPSGVGDGFSLIALRPASVISNVVFSNCVAQGSRLGTIVVPDGTPPGYNLTYQGDGFGIGSAPQSLGTIKNVVFANCASDANAHDGFGLVSTSSSQVMSSRASLNNRFGFFNGPGTKINGFLSNVGTSDTADYAGLTEPVFARAGLGGVTNKYINIAS
jgi:hypothetical protein